MKLLVSRSRCPHQFTTHFTGSWHVSEGNALGSKSACSHRMKKGTKIFSIDQMHTFWAEYHFQNTLCFHDQNWCVEWSEVANTHTHTHAQHFQPYIKWTLFTVFNFQENNCTEHVQPCAWSYGNLQFFLYEEEILHFIFQSIWYISMSEWAWNLFQLCHEIFKTGSVYSEVRKTWRVFRAFFNSTLNGHEWLLGKPQYPLNRRLSDLNLD